MQTYKELRDPTIFYHPKFGTSYVLDQRLSDNNKYIPMLIFGKVKPGSHLSQESGMASSGRCDSADCIPLLPHLCKSDLMFVPYFWFVQYSFTYARGRKSPMLATSGNQA